MADPFNEKYGAERSEKSGPVPVPKVGDIDPKDILKEFERYQNEKYSRTGGVEARTLVNLFTLEGEQGAYQRNGMILTQKRKPNQVRLVMNRIKKNHRKMLGRLSSVYPEFRARPSSADHDDMAQSEVVNALIPALNQKLGESAISQRIWFWMSVGGVAFEHTPWRPNVTVEPVPINDESGNPAWVDTNENAVVDNATMEAMVEGGVPKERFRPHMELNIVGDIDPEVLGPLNCFCPSSITELSKLPPDESFIIARVRSEGWVMENYPDVDLEDISSDDDIRIVKTNLEHVGDALSGKSIRDMLPVVQGTPRDKDGKVFVIIERYQPVSGTLPPGWSNVPGRAHGGRFTVGILGKKNLFDGELPYKDGIPVVDYHWETPTTTFWNGSWVEHLIPTQKAYNKSWSQLREYANAWINNPVLTEANAHTDQWPVDEPGCWVGGLADGQPQAARMEPAQIPNWYIKSIESLKLEIDELSGGATIVEQRSFPGQLRGPYAVPMLQELLDSEWGPVLTEYGNKKALAHMMRVNRVKQFYPAQRTFNYVGKQGKDEVLVFNTETVLRGGIDYNITVLPSSLVPEISAMREARIAERLNSPIGVLYEDDVTGNIDKSKLAADLQFGDMGRESIEAQDTKFARAVIDRILQAAEFVPPVLPIQNHSVFMRELSAVSNDMSFFLLSGTVQEALMLRAQEHQAILDEQMQSAQQASMDEAVQSAVAQAAQQAAAKAASGAVDAALEQTQIQENQGVDMQGLLQNPEQLI